ncbi:hypothetical protein [Streptomyces sp. NL15-2K]|uniref:hypothetical protein n=1 Tax=Streptomyces sp. NL15-2K TaxID=376149 RepID=UPI000FFA7CCC|nr:MULTISPECIES: hypothetical protein [Actinomycetes]WKX15948.1 hypothetical protein Q4V64_54105 [Kutzneria buriramensis]GCB52114.1 hypothetical protein SNL152K_9470 [Streptomyces sp. NL15-2K]
MLPRCLLCYSHTPNSAKYPSPPAQSFPAADPAEGREFTHELLDELPPDRNQRYIRQLLVHTGILGDRKEDIERIPGWLDTSSRTSRPRTPTSPARSCTGSCFGEHASGPPLAAIPPPPTVTCGAE